MKCAECGEPFADVNEENAAACEWCEARVHYDCRSAHAHNGCHYQTEEALEYQRATDPDGEGQP